VLYCSGHGHHRLFQGRHRGDYSILFTKSILDGALSILFASAMGIGVAFSAISVLVYQGLLTLVSMWLKPYVTPLMLAELTGIGGAFV